MVFCFLGAMFLFGLLENRERGSPFRAKMKKEGKEKKSFATPTATTRSLQDIGAHNPHNSRVASRAAVRLEHFLSHHTCRPASAVFTSFSRTPARAITTQQWAPGTNHRSNEKNKKKNSLHARNATESKQRCRCVPSRRRPSRPGPAAGAAAGRRR